MISICPDLNPIENIWANNIKYKFGGNASKKKMRSKILEVLDKLCYSLNSIKVNSMRKRTDTWALNNGKSKDTKV